jgi:hypothetical protein
MRLGEDAGIKASLGIERLTDDELEEARANASGAR